MSGLRKRIQRNSFWKLLGDGSRLLLAVFFLYVARHYGPKSFGVLSLLYSATIFISILADLGLNLLITRQVAAHKAQTAAYVRSFFTLKLASFPLWLIAPVVYWALCSPDKGMLALFSLLVLAHAARNILEFFGAVFSGWELIQYEAILKLSAHAVMLVLGLVVIAWRLPIYWIGAAMLGGYLLAAAAGAFWCQAKWGLLPLNLQSQDLAYLYKESLPLILLPVGLAILGKFDTLMLGMLGSTVENIGWYNASGRVIAALGMLPALLAAAAYPVFADLHHNDRGRFSSAQSRLLKLCFLAGALCAAVVFAAARPLLHILYGDAYAAAWDSLCWMALGLTFAFPNALILNVLVASGRSWDAAWTALIACAANVLLNLALIPRGGISGAAAASTAAQGALSLVGLMRLREARGGR